METNDLQLLMDETLEALAIAGASKWLQTVFKALSNQFIIYANERGLDSFSMDIGLQFLEDHYSMSQKIAEKKWNYMYSRCINTIAEYQKTKTVAIYIPYVPKDYDFPNGFKKSAESYISYRKKIGIIEKSIQVSRLYLFRFFTFLETKGIRSVEEITVSLALEFLQVLSAFNKPTINHMMRTVRFYLKYCYEDGFMKENLFPKLPNPHYNRDSNLPSTYTEEEVHNTLSAIDMGNPCGKRDYAIILLISRLGLRSSDVANLRFSNIDWENDRIRLIQAKTGNQLELPLLSDVGDAIITYLKDARPKSMSDHVFLSMNSPYTEFTPSAVGALVHRHLINAGVHIEGRKSGSHVLRHSLARRLLEHKIPLPVISEILGHANSETTMTYLRINIDELRKCALEVAK